MFTSYGRQPDNPVRMARFLWALFGSRALQIASETASDLARADRVDDVRYWGQVRLELHACAEKTVH